LCYNKFIKKINIRVSFGTTEIVSKNEKSMPMIQKFLWVKQLIIEKQDLRQKRIVERTEQIPNYFFRDFLLKLNFLQAYLL